MRMKPETTGQHSAAPLGWLRIQSGLSLNLVKNDTALSTSEKDGVL
jgi:hypothetical protein